MKNKIITITLSLICCLFTLNTSAQVFAKMDASGSNDGSSWENAFTDLQDAIDASEGSPIWVASGTWHPAAPGGSQTATFNISTDTKLYGGFNGTESSLDDRDIAANLTILSGDLNDDDIPNDLITNRSDNVQTILSIAANTTNATIVDGFTLIGGHADGTGDITPGSRGGAIYCLGLPIVSKCTFQDNFAESRGGAINVFLNTGSPTDTLQIDQCQFSKNQSNSFAGGLHFESVAPGHIIKMTASSFLENEGEGGSGAGVIFREGFSHGWIDDCLFDSNAANYGGGLHIEPEGDQCTYLVSNCTFTNNTAIIPSSAINNHGGGMWCFFDPGASNCDVQIENCEFYDNVSASVGGGLAVSYQSTNNMVMVNDCLFDNNSTSAQNFSEGGGAISVDGFDSNDNGSIIIANTTFNRNMATGAGGALDLYFVNDLEVEVQACTFTDNESNDQGLAIQVAATGLGSPELRINNCLFTDHEDPENAVINNSNFVKTTLSNNTLADNEAIGLLHQSIESLEMQNNIFYNPGHFNLASIGSIVSMGGNLLTDDSAADFLISTDRQVDDPKFTGVDPYPYQLSEESEAINTGVILGNEAEFDLAGNPRIQNDCLDAGAFESDFGPDCATVVGTKERMINNNSFSVTPNPATATVLLTLQNHWQNNIQLQIVNVVGQVVYSKQLEKINAEMNWELNIEHLESGAYFLLLSNSKEMIQQPMLKL